MNYSTVMMDTLWSDGTTLEIWHKIETETLAAQARTGLIPQEWADTARATPAPSLNAWRLAKEQTNHEVTAYLQATKLDHIHIGLTSSDLVDTANAYRICIANAVIRTHVEIVTSALNATAEENKNTERLARTHGQPAIPDTIGRRFNVLAEQIARCSFSITDIPGKISGPVGSYRHITPEVEQQVLSELGMWETADGEAPGPPACSQIVPRDFYSRWAWGMADLVSSCAAVGLEVRLMAAHQEAREGRPVGYTGSSAMPHKHNPNRSERLTGLGRIARSAAFAISEGIEQWQDRDLAHSSVERTYLPMLCGLADHALYLVAEILVWLEFNDANLRQNLSNAGREPYSHDHLTMLLREGTPYAQAVERTQQWVHEGV